MLGKRNEVMRELMDEYLLTLQNEYQDSWYTTDRVFAAFGLDGFYDWLVEGKRLYPQKEET